MPYLGEQPPKISARKVGGKFAPIFVYPDGSSQMVWQGMHRRFSGIRFDTREAAIDAGERHVAANKARNDAVRARFKNRK